MYTSILFGEGTEDISPIRKKSSAV